MDMSASPNAEAHARLSWRWLPLNAQSHAELREDWGDLADNASDPNIFSSPTYIAHSLPLLEQQKPYVLAVYNGDLLCGLTVLRGDLGYAKLPIPFAKSALHPEQYLGALLVRSGCEDDFATGLCNWLDNAPLRFCFVNLKLARASGRTTASLARHCEAQDRPLLKLSAFQRAAIVPQSGASGECDTHLSAGRRKSIRRAWNGLGKLGDLQLERLEQGGDLSVWLNGFLAMENSGWKGENKSSILSDRHEVHLYSEIIGKAHETGDLHFTRLSLDDRPIAYTLDIWLGDAAFCLKSAYDEQYRKFSPGVLMEHEALKAYSNHSRIRLVDSCSAADNHLLNELWPDQTEVTDFLIGRSGPAYRMLFEAITRIKRRSVSAGSVAP